MKKYSYDFRKPLIDLYETISDEELRVLKKCLGTEIKKFQFDEEHRANICYEDLEVGMYLYLWDDGPQKYGIPSDFRPYEIVITHIYGGIIFFKRVEFPELEEEYCPKNSYLGLHCFYPYEIIIKSGYEMICSCESTKIVVDDDLSTIGSYSTTYDFNDKKKFPKI